MTADAEPLWPTDPDEPAHGWPWVSPSTVLHDTINPGERMLRWAWKQGARGVLLNQANQTRRDQGTQVHAGAEKLARDPLTPLPVLAYPPGARGAIEAMNAWWSERQPTVIASEARCIDRDLMLRGIVDLVIQCPGCDRCSTAPCSVCGGKGWTGSGETATCAHCLGNPPGPGIQIVDFKTGYVDNLKSHMQVGGFYPILWHARARRWPCSSILVGLNLNGDREPVEVPAACTPADALEALRWYRTMTQRTESARVAAESAGVVLTSTG